MPVHNTSLTEESDPPVDYLDSFYVLTISLAFMC